ncbi:MAG: hypothetical protein OXH11_10445 [Candidatus Aminicenantes bacterium]|nr:hypothetical protein [Candidatus Aminicenantes bacterium]
MDGKDILPQLRDGKSPSAHEAIFGMMWGKLLTIRSGPWKLHVRSPGPRRYADWSPEELAQWVDRRGPDGVTILAPYEQPKPDRYPGLTGGDEPQDGMLFNLETDPGEQHDVSAQHLQVVQDLMARFEAMAAQVPEFEGPPRRHHLFGPPAEGERRPFMRLIGGELRYDRIPKSQQHLLTTEPE